MSPNFRKETADENLIISEVEANIGNYYKSLGGQSELEKDKWYVDYDRHFLFSIYSDYDALDEREEKIVVEPVSQLIDYVNDFSVQSNKVFNRTKVSNDSSGNEIIELSLDERIITFIVDQSGSMTWNDNGGFRHQVMKTMIDEITQTYPGTIKYNLIRYGSTFVNILFFGQVQDPQISTTSINSLNSLYYADSDANFAGIRVVRNNEHYPTSYLDGEIVSEGFIGKAFDEDLTEGKKYYYTVYTHDKDYRFSEGKNISIVPKTRLIPRGISIFKSWIESDNIEKGEVLIGSGVIRDENTAGIWHFDEGKENTLFDFSDSKANLSFNLTPQWLIEQSVPAGTSGVRFNGIDTNASYWDNENKLVLEKGEQITLMGWIFPYKSERMMICMRQRFDPSVNENPSFDDINYIFLMTDDRRLLFSNGIDTVSSEENVINLNEWSHVSVTVNDLVVKFYVNAVLKGECILNSNLTSSIEDMWFDLGYNRSSFDSASNFYGKITEFSVHSIERSIDYIGRQATLKDVIDSRTNEIATDPETGSVIQESVGSKGDNGDRLVILKYEIPSDYNFSGGEVRIVKNEKSIPSWEEDGEIVSQISNVSPGIYYATDTDDFVCGEKYYYKIFSRNSDDNFNFYSDSSPLTFEIPKVSSNNIYVPVLDSSLSSPEIDYTENVIIPGNKKIFLRWANDPTIDNRVKRVKIYYSYSNYPTLHDDGGSSGELVFTGLIADTKFIHRNLENDQAAYYTIANIDKYGRTSSAFLPAMSVPSEDADEGTIPLFEVDNIHYELVDANSVSILWDLPVNVKEPYDVSAYFDQTVVLYATITDEFGAPVSDDTLVDMVLEANVTKESDVDDVFGIIDTTPFKNEDIYNLTVSGPKDGLIKATLRMTSNAGLISQIKEVMFNVRVKSYIPNVHEDLEDVFEYLSEEIIVNFTNPWQLELINRDDKFITERCYRIEENEITKEKSLVISYAKYDGIYIRSSNPFMARAKITFKGEPVPSGSIDLAVWDAEMNICSCAGKEECDYKGEKIQPSRSVTIPFDIADILQGTEEQLNAQGELVNVPISYVDIPIGAPQMSQSVLLFAKGTHAGFSSVRSLYIVFPSTLKIDINASSPITDGKNVAEQFATTYIVNPDHPEDNSYNTYPDDESIVQWQIVPIEGAPENINRYLYSIDNITIPNGIFSYVRNGTARNVFFGPIDADNQEIDETYEIDASIVYKGLSAVARQFIKLENKPSISPVFGARFLMELEYHYRFAENNKLWTDGEDYITGYISRNPRIATTRFSRLFRNCSDEENKPLLELNTSGQVVFIETGEDNCEILWGDVSETFDEYTGERYLRVGKEGHVERRSGYVELNSEEISDTTPFYIRCNKFFKYCKDCCRSDPECNESESINLRCLKLDQCDLPGGDIFVTGSTTLFVDGEPVVLRGGGGMKGGVPPCPICFNEPLRIKTIWQKIDGEIVEDFYDAINERSLLDSSSRVDIRVQVSYRNQPVPNGTPVYVTIKTDEIVPLFSAQGNIVYTFIDGGKSYADVVVIANRMPDETTIEELTIMTTYSPLPDRSRDGRKYRVNKVEREKSAQFSLEITHEDTKIGEEEASSSSSAIADIQYVEPDIYSSTIERYDINSNSWQYLSGLSENKGDVFIGNSGEEIYVIGGLKDNDYSISSVTESYNFSTGDWEIKAPMITPRFGGLTFVVNGEIYTIGGMKYDEANESLRVSNEVEVYSPALDSWSSRSSMPNLFAETIDESSYGVAFGAGEHVADIQEGSNVYNYIYVLSGFTEVRATVTGTAVSKYNDRILRYCVESNEWEYSRILYSHELESYQRISPLSIFHNNKIIVFNGAIDSSNGLEYLNTSFYIDAEEDFSNIKIVIGGDNFGNLPIAKYQSSLVKYELDPSARINEYYIIGGANSDSDGLDIVERISENSSSPFTYQNSYDNNISPLPIGKSGMKSCVGYYTDEYGVVCPNIYVVGGYTVGRGSKHVNIEFDI